MPVYAIRIFVVSFFLPEYGVFFSFSRSVSLCCCTLAELPSAAVPVAEYVGNYFQTTGKFLRLIFLLCEVLVGSSSFRTDCMALP